MKVLHEIDKRDWQEAFSADEQRQAIDALESGQILYFPRLEFPISTVEQEFIAPRYLSPKAKNISYNPKQDLIRNISAPAEKCAQYKVMMRNYAKAAQGLVENILPIYSSKLIVGRTSFRPMEIEGRKSSYRKDDTRLHVDAFPSTPTNGERIMRVFTNVNPDGQDRVWRVGEPFEKVANQFLARVPRQIPGSAFLLNLFKITRKYRTEYDHIMLHIHDKMKADLDYQQTADQAEIHLPPGSTWIVKTDQVSHAAIRGQHVFEQTFYLPLNAMFDEQRAPLRVLERLTGRELI